jgi:hypothetical protein
MRCLSLLLLASMLLVACIEDTDEPSPPENIGPRLYAYHPFCWEECSILTLYYTHSENGSGYEVELRATRPDGSYMGRQLATMWPEASDELDALRDVDELGAPPTGVPSDVELIELWLPDLSLTYPKGYPPSGLVELDAFLMRLLDDVSQCRNTTRVDTPWECEQLAAYPE